MGKVTVSEALSVKIGRFFIEQGYVLADSSGEAITSISACNSIGLLKPDYKTPVSWLERLFFRPRREFWGKLHISLIVVEEEEQDEVFLEFDVYGRANLNLASDLAEKLAATFNLDVDVTLLEDEPKIEALSGDGVW